SPACTFADSRTPTDVGGRSKIGRIPTAIPTTLWRHATVRERKPGVWEVRAFTGRDERGRPTQVSRTVRGTKRDALRVAAELTVRPLTRAASPPEPDPLAQRAEQNEAISAASTRRHKPG